MLMLLAYQGIEQDCSNRALLVSIDPECKRFFVQLLNLISNILIHYDVLTGAIPVLENQDHSVQRIQSSLSQKVPGSASLPLLQQDQHPELIKACSAMPAEAPIHHV